MDENLYIFPDLKMCLYKGELYVGSNDRVETELERLRIDSNGRHALTVEDLMVEHLSAILEATLSAVEAAEERHGVFSKEEIRAMPRHCIFTVPEITTLKSNRKFAAMIKRAGLPSKIGMVSETEAATAQILRECGLVDGQVLRGLKVSSFHPNLMASLLRKPR